MSTTRAPTGRELTACRPLAEGREKDDAIIDHLLFDDTHWVEDFDGWLIDQSLEESGIIIDQAQETE
jgi:hypothetical protein